MPMRLEPKEEKKEVQSGQPSVNDEQEIGSGSNEGDKSSGESRSDEGVSKDTGTTPEDSREQGGGSEDSKESDKGSEESKGSEKSSENPKETEEGSEDSKEGCNNPKETGEEEDGDWRRTAAAQFASGLRRLVMS